MEKTEKRILAIVAAIFVVLAVAAAIVAVKHPPKSVKYVPPAFDEAAVVGIPTDAGESYSKMAAKEGLSVWICGAPKLIDGDLELYFTADEDNTCYVRLLVLTEDGKQIGSTGLLRPGEYVRLVSLDKSLHSGDAVVLKILSYEPETYYSLGSFTAKVLVYGE